jgi:hypothetical protein
MMKRRLFLAALLLALLPWLSAEPYSSRYGYRIDLPPGYLTSFAGPTSFRNPQGALFEITVVSQTMDPEQYLRNVLSQKGSKTTAEAFDYHGRKAALAEFSPPGARGWALCLALDESRAALDESRAALDQGLLLALAYGGPQNNAQELLHLSCLDSIAPTPAEQYYWGPITEYAWPRGEVRETRLFNTDVTAMIAAEDAEAAQYLVDREFQILRQFEKSARWQETWQRFYRMIYRDSWERLADAAFRLERQWNAEALLAERKDAGYFNGLSATELAARALTHVQGFTYERDLMGSDFVNLVSALTEGRGDCDSRALLWAVILSQANIDAGIMVSRDYSHAMGIADIPGQGARFPFNDKQFMVAETTAKVGLGLIGQNVSEIAKWLGVDFE